MFASIIKQIPSQISKVADTSNASLIPESVRKKYSMGSITLQKGVSKFIDIAQLIEKTVIAPIKCHAEMVGKRLFNVLVQKYQFNQYLTFSECVFFFKDGHSSQYQLNRLTEIVII